MVKTKKAGKQESMVRFVLGSILIVLSFSSWEFSGWVLG